MCKGFLHFTDLLQAPEMAIFAYILTGKINTFWIYSTRY